MPQEVAFQDLLTIVYDSSNHGMKIKNVDKIQDGCLDEVFNFWVQSILYLGRGVFRGPLRLTPFGGENFLY